MPCLPESSWIILHSRNYYYFHKEEETEAWGRKITCPRPHKRDKAQSETQIHLLGCPTFNHCTSHLITSQTPSYRHPRGFSLCRYCPQDLAYIFKCGSYCLYYSYCVLSRFSHVRLFATPWTVIRRAPLSMGFSRQEYWSGLPCPPPGDLSDPGLKPASFTSLALAGRFFTPRATTKRETESQKSEVMCPRSQSYSIMALLNLSSPLFKVL